MLSWVWVKPNMVPIPVLITETVVSRAPLKFGILVDTVQEVLEIEDHKLLPTPTLGKAYNTTLIIGVVERNHRFVMVIDINELIDKAEMLMLEKK